MSQQRTFSKLKQKISHAEMLKIWKEFYPCISPVYQICATTFERKVDYPETTFLFEKMKILEEYGWTLEELAAESERKAVRHTVEVMNQQLNNLDPEIINHAKKFFPNLKFTPASIEFGDE